MINTPETIRRLPPEEEARLRTSGEWETYENFLAEGVRRGSKIVDYFTAPPPPPAPLDPMEEQIRAAQERDPLVRHHQIVRALTPEQRGKIWEETELAAYLEEGRTLGTAEAQRRSAEAFEAARSGRVRAWGSSMSPSEIEAAQPKKPILRESQIESMGFAERRVRAAELCEAYAEGRIMTVERERELGLL
jgi:hypothetical protein